MRQHGKREREPSGKAHAHVLVGCVVALAVLALLLFACIIVQRGRRAEGRMIPLETNEANTRALGITDRYTFDIPADAADMIRVQAGASENAVVFYCILKDEEVPAFQLTIGTSDGFEVGKVTSNGTTLAVYAEMYRPPDSISEADLDRFYSVQEMVNEVHISEKTQ